MTGEQSQDKQIETPLASILKDQVAQKPITVGEYVDACLHHPKYGYYRNQAAIGQKADFITAPEISQVFGELIGLWAAITWQAMGSPEHINLVEIGPGRGTMMKDALRALRVVPAFCSAIHVHLIESNPVLRDIQSDTLENDGLPLTWHHDLMAALGANGAVSTAPTILLANEFLDTFPVEQFIKVGDKWDQRLVAMKNGAFVFENAPTADPPVVPTHLVGHEKPDDIFEVCTGFENLARDILAERALSSNLAALFVDYGHMNSGFGESLQAVKEHNAVSVFHAPGESDLTAQVDFEAFTRHCRTSNAGGKRPLEVDGPVTQAAFLGALGIGARASRLMASNPAIAGRIESGITRLMAPNGMGGLFKVCAVRSKTLPPLIGIA